MPQLPLAILNPWQTPQEQPAETNTEPNITHHNPQHQVTYFQKSYHAKCYATAHHHEACTFLYEGGFIVLLITLTAYGGTSEIAPIANTLHKKPLSAS